MRLFRVAEVASFRRNYAKTLLQTAVMWTIFLVVGPILVAQLEGRLGLPTFTGNVGVGVVLFILGGSLGLRSGYVMTRVGEGTPLPMDTARNLVIAGPYRRVRNPMAVAGTVQSMAVGVALGSPAVFAATAFSAMLWNYAVRPTEEADLLERFGEPFERYTRNVPCWIPRLDPWTVASPEGDR